MLEYDFEESVGYWLVTAHHTYIKAFQQALAPHDITMRQAQVLGCIAVHGPISQREIADLLLIEPPNLVGVIDRMEAARLVERRPCDDDLRKKLIHPLPAAKKQWAKIADCGRMIREQALAGLRASEREQLRCLLSRLQENLTAPVALAK